MVRCNIINNRNRWHLDIHRLDLCTIGFFQMKTPAQQSATQQQYGYAPPPPPTAQAATKFCPNCGAPVANQQLSAQTAENNYPPPNLFFFILLLFLSNHTAL